MYKINFIENTEKWPTEEEDFIDFHTKRGTYALDLSKEYHLYMKYLDQKYSWCNETLESFTKNNIPKGWEEFFEKELHPTKGSIPKLSKFLNDENTGSYIFPSLINIYKAFELVQPLDIKVIICGQDPYHDTGQAMGLSFSVPDGVTPPPSLKNIYKELESEGFTINNKSIGNLTKWAEQGVLMINTGLTVRAHQAKSHSDKWLESFTPALMKWLNQKCNPLVLILWGVPAQKIGNYFTGPHKKIQCAHPSPLSASRGFFGSGCFIKASQELKKLGYEDIDWSL